MITTAELHRVAEAEGLRFDQAEKDYVILWVLYALSRPGFVPKGWAFKGGTCLRHCYYPDYRFSEDIDFSCQPREDFLGHAVALLNRITAWVQETSGIRLVPKAPQTIPGDFQVVAEKMRALLQQQKKWPRPRDLYDLWFILCRSGERFPREELKKLFVEKCQVRRIEPNREGLISENLKEWNRQAWGNLLGPMLKTLPDYDEVWREWVTVCHDIFA